LGFGHAGPDAEEPAVRVAGGVFGVDGRIERTEEFPARENENEPGDGQKNGNGRGGETVPPPATGKRKEKKGETERIASEKLAARARENLNPENRPLAPGDSVRIKGTNSIGEIESIQGKQVIVIYGGLRTKVKLEQLERTDKAKEETKTSADKHAHLAIQTSHMTRATMEDRRQNFHQDLDVRGMRGDEAIDTVMHFIDDAILIGLSRVRILHGTGTGILRQLIRQYLATVPNVKKAKDEHVQFGGAGITVVDLE
jgi:DNA mismatch repair protein MutS2